MSHNPIIKTTFKKKITGGVYNIVHFYSIL